MREFCRQAEGCILSFGRDIQDDMKPLSVITNNPITRERLLWMHSGTFTWGAALWLLISNRLFSLRRRYLDPVLWSATWKICKQSTLLGYILHTIIIRNLCIPKTIYSRFMKVAGKFLDSPDIRTTGGLFSFEEAGILFPPSRQ